MHEKFLFKTENGLKSLHVCTISFKNPFILLNRNLDLVFTESEYTIKLS